MCRFLNTYAGGFFWGQNGVRDGPWWPQMWPRADPKVERSRGHQMTRIWGHKTVTFGVTKRSNFRSKNGPIFDQKIMNFGSKNWSKLGSKKLVFHNFFLWQQVSFQRYNMIEVGFHFKTFPRDVTRHASATFPSAHAEECLFPPQNKIPKPRFLIC